MPVCNCQACKARMIHRIATKQRPPAVACVICGSTADLLDHGCVDCDNGEAA